MGTHRHVRQGWIGRSQSLREVLIPKNLQANGVSM